MLEVLKFIGKVLGIVAILLLAFYVGLLIYSNNIQKCPECQSGVGIGNSNPKSDIGVGTVKEEERICKFADGYDSNGKVVPSGTKVTGPAFAKPDRNVDLGIPIYVGETYKTIASDEVIWLLIGDNACVDAQSMFFTYWSKTNFK